MGTDDEIADAEVLEDEDAWGAVEVWGGDDIVPKGPVGRGVAYRSTAPAHFLIHLTHQERMIVREALGHYHDHGPRDRNTRMALDLIRKMADLEDQACPRCSGSGGYRVGLKDFTCGCGAGLNRRGG